MPSDQTRITGYRQPSGEGSGWLVVIHAPQRRLLGAHLPLGRAEVTLGRDAGCDLVLDAEDVSRRHARVRAEGGGHRLEDLGSTNGTFVGGERVGSRVLAAGDLIRLGSVVLKYLAGDEVEALYHAELRRISQEDPLTGLAHKGTFDEALAREVARSRRHGNPLTMAILDLDHFKEVNDRFGHLAGDLVLRELPSLLRPLVRAEQLLARVGGEELALLLPDVPLEKAALFAEKVRRLVESHTFAFQGERIAVTVSVGLASLEPGDLDPEALQARADARLYEAKRGGRNRVAC
jgi:two-component system, cell cycle response regulator